MKILLASFVFVFYLTSALPLIQMYLEPLPTREVSGLKVPKKPPGLSRESLSDGSFQKKAEDWFLKKNGIWGSLVRLDNQINYMIFRQISASYRSSVLVGKDYYLFQSLYLKSFNRLKSWNASAVKNKVEKIHELRQLLAEYNIPLILFISANKLEVYPEIVPGKYRDPNREQRESTYEIAKQHLDKHQIDYLDGYKFLSDRKNDHPMKLYTRTGSHWNDIGACLITDQLVERMESLLGKTLVHFTCEPYKIKEKPNMSDLDLVEICNLWKPSVTYRPTPYPLTEPIIEGQVYKPKVLFIGTSFMWSVLRFLDYHQVYRKSDFYYYYQKNRNYPSHTFVNLNKRKIDWRNDILSNDVIVVEINQSIIESAGQGFIEDAIAKLRALKGKKLEPK